MLPVRHEEVSIYILIKFVANSANGFKFAWQFKFFASMPSNWDVRDWPVKLFHLRGIIFSLLFVLRQGFVFYETFYNNKLFILYCSPRFFFC